MNYVSNPSQIPILVYYNFRGQLQPLRTFFCYLEIPFFQIHLERLQQQINKIPETIMTHFKKFKIDKSQLPALIHQDFMTQGQLPIMTYICRKFNRNDLLGQSMQLRAKIQQILEIYFLKQPQSMKYLFFVADYALEKHTPEQIAQYRFRQLVKVLQAGYAKPMCEYIHMQQNPKYVLGKITVLDFFFAESCFYMVGTFDTSKQSYLEEKQQQAIKKTTLKQKSIQTYFLIMERFMHRFRQEPFYVKYKEYLEGFKICSFMTPEERVNGLKKVWLADPKFVK